jgi:hypothetical protein
MVDSSWLGAVVDERAAGATEFVVERDRRGEADEALQDVFSGPGEGSCAVAFEGEEVFAGLEDRLDPLADGKTDRVIPQGDEEGLATAVRALLEDPAMSKRMGRRDSYEPSIGLEWIA